MPQMAPLNWIVMTTIFALILLTIVIKLFFSSYNFNKSPSSLSQSSLQKNIWPW